MIPAQTIQSAPHYIQFYFVSTLKYFDKTQLIQIFVVCFSSFYNLNSRNILEKPWNNKIVQTSLKYQEIFWVTMTHTDAHRFIRRCISP
jgi:hypothetical protein